MANASVFGKEAFKPHNLRRWSSPVPPLFSILVGLALTPVQRERRMRLPHWPSCGYRGRHHAAAILGWIFGEWALRGKPSCWARVLVLLRVWWVTPACDYIGVGGALIIGVVAGLAGLWGVTILKRILRVDDPCDVFGVPGIVRHCRLHPDRGVRCQLSGRGLCRGVTMGHQLLVQLESVAITIVWSVWWLSWL